MVLVSLTVTVWDLEKAYYANEKNVEERFVPSHSGQEEPVLLVHCIWKQPPIICSEYKRFCTSLFS